MCTLMQVDRGNVHLLKECECAVEERYVKVRWRGFCCVFVASLGIRLGHKVV